MISQETKDRAVELLREGIPSKHIQRRLGLCYDTMLRIRREAGLDGDVPRYSEATLAGQDSARRSLESYQMMEMMKAAAEGTCGRVREIFLALADAWGEVT